MSAMPYLLLALLSVMSGRIEGEMTCYVRSWGGGQYYVYLPQDVKKCWGPDINAIFDGKEIFCEELHLLDADSKADCETTATKVSPQAIGTQTGALLCKGSLFATRLPLMPALPCATSSG